MKNAIFAVAMGVTCNLLSGVPFLPSARAECVMTADPCSTEAGSEECCFAETGAVCDTNADGGSCCFPTVGDDQAVCSQNDDCCGGLLCVASVCSDTIEFTVEDVQYTMVMSETEYGSGEYVASEVTVQDPDSPPVVFTLDGDGDVTEITSEGETLYPLPDTPTRQLQTYGKGAISTVIETANVDGIYRSTRNLTEGGRLACEAAANILCGIAGTAACLAVTNVFGALACGGLAAAACFAAAGVIEDACEDIVDCTGDPHMRGLQGQKFDFSGKDGGWYAIMHEQSFFVNMRVTAPIVDLDEITYITGLGISVTDTNHERHTVVMTVNNPFEMQPECPGVDKACLADGALTVELDGISLTEPGEVSLGGGVFFAAANIPGECRPFGFEKYWQKKADAQDALIASNARRLGLAPTGLWILADEHKTNPAECKTYVRTVMEDGTLFTHQSEHASIQIRADDLAIRVNHGKIHQLAMRDPTDQFDLPDHIAYQMNIAFERINVGDYPQGVIGATAHIAKDEYGEDIMNGPGAIPGEEEDYRVSGPLGTDFIASSS